MPHAHIPQARGALRYTPAEVRRSPSSHQTIEPPKHPSTPARGLLPSGPACSPPTRAPTFLSPASLPPTFLAKALHCHAAPLANVIDATTQLHRVVSITHRSGGPSRLMATPLMPTLVATHRTRRTPHPSYTAPVAIGLALTLHRPRRRFGLQVHGELLPLLLLLDLAVLFIPFVHAHVLFASLRHLFIIWMVII